MQLKGNYHPKYRAHAMKENRHTGSGVWGYVYLQNSFYRNFDVGGEWGVSCV